MVLSNVQVQSCSNIIYRIFLGCCRLVDLQIVLNSMVIFLKFPAYNRLPVMCNLLHACFWWKILKYGAQYLLENILMFNTKLFKSSHNLLDWLRCCWNSFQLRKRQTPRIELIWGFVCKGIYWDQSRCQWGQRSQSKKRFLWFLTKFWKNFPWTMRTCAKRISNHQKRRCKRSHDGSHMTDCTNRLHPVTVNDFFIKFRSHWQQH